jgi:hypothetical protein
MTQVKKKKKSFGITILDKKSLLILNLQDMISQFKNKVKRQIIGKYPTLYPKMSYQVVIKKT